MREHCGTSRQSQAPFDRGNFKKAYYDRDFDTMREFANRYPEDMVQFLKRHEYFYYHYAAEKGALDLMKFLPELMPSIKDEIVQEMVQGCNGYCFLISTANGHVAVMQHLVELASNKQSSVSIYNFIRLNDVQISIL